MLINVSAPTRASALVRCKYILGAFLLGLIAGRDGGHASVRATSNTNDAELAGVPAASDIGTSSNIVIAARVGGQSASMAPPGIQVTPPPLPPSSPLVIAVQPNNFAQVLAPYVLTPIVREHDSGRVLAFSISGKPTWATFDPLTGTLSGTPQYIDMGTVSNIVINVSDGVRSDSTGRFSIEVVYSVHVSRRS